MTATVRKLRRSRRGMTLMEVAVAAFLMALLSVSGASYFYYSRLAQIRGMQENVATNLAEIHLERFREQGYGALAGFTTPTSLPYGYNYDWTASQRTDFPYIQTVDGIRYRITAGLLYNTSTSGANYRWEVTVGGVTYRYRRVLVQVQWGDNFGTSVVHEASIGE